MREIGNYTDVHVGYLFVISGLMLFLDI